MVCSPLRTYAPGLFLSLLLGIYRSSCLVVYALRRLYVVVTRVGHEIHDINIVVAL